MLVQYLVYLREINSQLWMRWEKRLEFFLRSPVRYYRKQHDPTWHLSFLRNSSLLIFCFYFNVKQNSC